MTFDIGLHEECERVVGRAGVRYVITKFFRMDSLPNFVTMVLRCVRFARKSSAINLQRFLRDLASVVQTLDSAIHRIKSI